MATVGAIGIDVAKKVASCLPVSRKRLRSIAPDGWSDSDSDFEKENKAKVGNIKRLSLSGASGSKRFKRVKTEDIEEAKKPNPPVNTKRNTNWAVKNFQI